MDLIACSGCGSDVSGDAEACPDCGYSMLGGEAIHISSDESARRAARREYGWIQLLGLIVFCAGVAAAIVESHFAAVAAITTGVATFFVGLIGLWWTRH